MEDYYGNEHGMVLGPYASTEIKSRLKAQELLRTAWGSASRDLKVYAIKAKSVEAAEVKLEDVLRQERG